jgi:hypothetical protein
MLGSSFSVFAAGGSAGGYFSLITIEDVAPSAGAGIAGLLLRDVGVRLYYNAYTVGVFAFHIAPVMCEMLKIPAHSF